MVMVRAALVSLVAADGLAQSVTIAIRYSCIRHQSELKPGYVKWHCGCSLFLVDQIIVFILIFNDKTISKIKL